MKLAYEIVNVSKNNIEIMDVKTKVVSKNTKEAFLKGDKDGKKLAEIKAFSKKVARNLRQRTRRATKRVLKVKPKAKTEVKKEAKVAVKK